MSSLWQNYASLPVELKCVHVTFFCQINKTRVCCAMFLVPSATEALSVLGSGWTEAHGVKMVTVQSRAPANDQNKNKGFMEGQEDLSRK